MVGAAVAAASGRLDLEASGNITKIRVENPDPHGSRTGSMQIRIRMDPRTGPVFALFEMRTDPDSYAKITL